MTTAAASDLLLPPGLRVREFFLARQPIVNREQNLVGYELLFRGTQTNAAHIINDLSATAAVIAHTSQLGLEKVVGDSIGFLNVDAAVLMSDIFQFLPREKVVLEIMETVKATPEVLQRISELATAGFQFALDDVIADSEDVKQLLPMVDIVKLDLRDMSSSALRKLAPRFKQSGKRLVAEKVESPMQFQACLELGFDYFQGYYFAKPVILTGKKLSPSQVAIMRLMKLLMSDADNHEIEEAIKRDVTLGLNLLRLVNTPAVGMRHRIDSLNQALLVLGREQLRRWLQIMLYAEPCKKGQSMTPLLSLASARGKLLELLAQAIYPNQRKMADTAFTVGIMSLLDALFGLPMENIVQEMPVVDEVSSALLFRDGHFGELLRVAECLEQTESNTDELPALLQRLALSDESLYQMEIAAFEWSNGIARAALQADIS